MKPKEPPPTDKEARLCTGAFRVKDAFQEVMQAVAAASCPQGPSLVRRPPRARASSRWPVVKPLEAPPVPRPKWEIDAALDFAFSELQTPPSKASPEEIAATLDNALPEEASLFPVRGASSRAAEVFVIPYDFELRCLLSAGQVQANPHWVPASILRSAPGQEEKKN